MNHSSQLRATIEIQHHRDGTGESNEKEGSEDCDTINDAEEGGKKAEKKERPSHNNGRTKRQRQFLEKSQKDHNMN